MSSPSPSSKLAEPSELKAKDLAGAEGSAPSEVTAKEPLDAAEDAMSVPKDSYLAL